MSESEKNTTEIFSGSVLHRLFELHDKRMEEALSRIGLNYSQYVVLAAAHNLNEEFGEVTQVMITDFSKLDKSVVSTTIKRLSEKGMIIRQENKSDSRAKSVRLSEDGESYFRLGFDIVRQTDRAFLGEDESESRELNERLTRLLRRIEATETDEDDE